MFYPHTPSSIGYYQITFIFKKKNFAFSSRACTEYVKRESIEIARMKVSRFDKCQCFLQTNFACHSVSGWVPSVDTIIFEAIIARSKQNLVGVFCVYKVNPDPDQDFDFNKNFLERHKICRER